MLPRVHPMRLRLVKEPFNDPDYNFELKHDGFRAIAYIEHGECKLVSRNLKHLRFKALEEALATLPVQNAIIDGEIVCIDANGVSQFNELLNRKAEPVLYAFVAWLKIKNRKYSQAEGRHELLTRRLMRS
jgi:bifunctional non-homologous end joining protein LigD